MLRAETSLFLKIKVFLFKGNWQWDSHRNLLYFWRNQWNGQVSKNFQVHLQIKFCLHLRGRNTFEGYILTNIIDNFKWEKVNLLKNYLNENLICNFWNKYGLEMIIHCQALVQVISWWTVKVLISRSTSRRDLDQGLVAIIAPHTLKLFWAE